MGVAHDSLRSGSPAGDSGAPLTLGTAGHIDHGKTALVTLLTGKNTDRLREERERGISIELGYAELELPGGGRLSVVDVPGHERFVRTMVAGATGIDLFLLVVAADDGVMPQTLEHLAILELLGVERGVVALTKADLVDDELLALAAADVREYLATTAYAGSDIVAVSARDGRGSDELLAALERVVGGVAAARREGPARLPVDRVFPLKGIGTVVTGTLWRGEVRPGDPLVVEPGAVRTTVRSVQAHDRDAAVVSAGSRVGLNLRGLDREAVTRGSWLVAPELAGHVTRRLDAWVTILPGERPLRGDEQVRLHHGTGQYLARIRPVQGREIAAGAHGAAVVRLEVEAAVEPHDRFIVRSLSPVATVGGGEVLAVGGRRWREPAGHAVFLTAVHDGDAVAAARALAVDQRDGGVEVADLAAAGFGAGAAGAALAAAAADGHLEVLRASGDRGPGAARWFVAGKVAALRAALLTGAAERAAARSGHPFVSGAELAALTPALPSSAVETLLRQLVAEGALVAGEGGYAPAGAAGVLSAGQAALADDLLGLLRGDRFAPPTLAGLVEQTRRPAGDIGKVLDALARRGDVVRVDKDLWFCDEAVAEARRRLEVVLARDGEVTLAGFRDVLACGRRNAQALLELFDREGLTLRHGDVRVARARR